MTVVLPAMAGPAIGGLGWGAMAETDAARGLARMVASERLPQALLLTGPAKVGKAQLAVSLAQALNCLERGSASGEVGGDRCGECRACRRIAEGKYADVETIAPGGLCRVSDHDHTKLPTIEIGICQIRRLEMLAAMNPYEGRRRVLVIDPADMLRGDASDALLKTLEEPPEGVTLVLVTDSPARLSETVRSRCRRIEVTPLPQAVLSQRLAELEAISAEDAETLSRMAHGCAGLALAAIGDGEPIEQRRAQIEDVRRLSAAGVAERLAFAESLVGRRNDAAPARLALESWREWWRDLLRVRLGVDQGITHEFLRAELELDAPRYQPDEIVAFLRELRRTEELLRISVGVLITLEALMLAMPRPVARQPVRSAP